MAADSSHHHAEEEAASPSSRRIGIWRSRGDIMSLLSELV
jgi:hypothetical protein